MYENTARIAAIGIFSALTLAGGYLFIAIPNVEILTASVFISGIVLGSRNGMLIGFISQSLFSVFNPYGASPPPLFIVQVLNKIFVGYVGGRFQAYFEHDESSLKRTGVVLGITGLLLTWLFDLMADFSFFFVSGFSLQQMKVTFTLGLPWYLIHGIGNLLIFLLVIPVVVKALRRVEYLKTIS